MTDNGEVAENEVEIKDDGPSRKRMTVRIPALRVSKELDSNYDQLRKSVTIKGFRPGHVPRRLLENRFATQVEADVRDGMVRSAFEAEVEKGQLQIIGEPTFDKVEFKAGEPLSFETVFEVIPSFELIPYHGLEFEEKPVAVLDDDVSREIEELRQSLAEMKDISFGEQAPADFVHGKLALTHEGETLWEGNEYDWEIGKDEALRMPIPGAVEQLLGLKGAGSVEFTVRIPDDHLLVEHRGKSCALIFQARQVRRREAPNLNEEFYKRFEVEGEADFRGQIRKTLEMRRKLEEEYRQERELVDQLLPRVTMELPERTVEKRRRELSTPVQLKLYEQGKTPEEIQKIIENDKELDDQARRDVKEFFLLDQIATKEKLFVTEDEVAVRMQALARTYGRPAAEIAEEYRSSGRLQSLRDGLMREKVRRLIRQKAKVTPGGAATAEDQGKAAESKHE